MRVKNSIPDFRDGNWRTVFSGIPGIGNSRDIVISIAKPRKTKKQKKQKKQKKN